MLKSVFSKDMNYKRVMSLWCVGDLLSHNFHNVSSWCSLMVAVITVRALLDNETWGTGDCTFLSYVKHGLRVKSFFFFFS